jgi:hypothetical protein
VTDYFTELFAKLDGTDDRGLLTYLSTPGLKEVGNYVWDTRLPVVTDPWPTLDPLDLDDMIHQMVDEHSELVLKLT